MTAWAAQKISCISHKLITTGWTAVCLATILLTFRFTLRYTSADFYEWLRLAEDWCMHPAQYNLNNEDFLLDGLRTIGRTYADASLRTQAPLKIQQDLSNPHYKLASASRFVLYWWVQALLLGVMCIPEVKPSLPPYFIAVIQDFFKMQTHSDASHASQLIPPKNFKKAFPVRLGN